MLTIDDLAQEIRRVDGSHSLGAGALAEALMPFITAALSEKQAAEVAIKPLEWRDGDGAYAFSEITQKNYSIAFEEGKYWAAWDARLRPFDTLEAAKAAAQSDYEQRIRSAFVDVPVEPVAGYRRRLPQYAFEHYEFEQPGYENPSISDWEALYAHPPLSHRGEDSAEVVTLTRAEADRIAQRLEFDASWDKCGDGYYSIKRQLGTLAATRSGSTSTTTEKGADNE